MRSSGQFSRSNGGPCKTAQVRSLTKGTEESSEEKKRKVKLFGKTLTVEVVVSSVPAGAMADSGAEVSLVTEEWYKRHLLPKEAVIHGMDIRITDANGMEIPCLGYVQVDVEVEGKVV